MKRLLPLAILAAGAVSAQSVSGPSLGLIFDAGAHAIRSLDGVPSGAAISPAIDFGIPLTMAAIAPQRDYALAESSASEGVWILRRSDFSSRPVAELMPGADLIVFSPSANAVALYYANSGTIQIVTGLPDNVNVGPSLASGTLPGIQSLAVSDDGAFVLAGTSEPAGGAVYLLGGGIAPRLILNVASPDAITFLHGRNDALIADGPRNQISLVRSVDTAPQTTILAGAAQGIAKPAALQISLDNQRVAIAGADSNQLTILNLANGTASSLKSQARISSLTRLNGNLVLALNQASSSPMLLLDGDSAEPRIVFVAETGSMRRKPVGKSAK